jgi:hypothetical protein
VRLEQPPFSVVVTYDTSGSMNEWLSFTAEALRVFALGITPGEEAVQIIPFQSAPLLPDFIDDRYLVANAVAGLLQLSGSSAAEIALGEAVNAVSPRLGAKAILLITDAETSSFTSGPELWQQLDRVRPQVFAVHVAGGNAPAFTTHLMQDWAASWGGHYQYAASHGEIDQAFERLATWLRRPAGYTLGYTTRMVLSGPGTLSVIGPEGGGVVAGRGVGIEIILDTSGSMLERLKGERRINLAKAVLRDLVRERLPAGAPVAVRVLGDRTAVCGTRLVVPLGPLDAERVVDLVDAIHVDQAADTPLGLAISSVAGDLAGASSTRILLLITDSEEIWPHVDLCGQDPEVAIRGLVSQGIDVRLNIVGLAVNARKARRQMERWAEIGGGTYYDAGGGAQLGEAVALALRAPFQVYDASGDLVASGVVGGDALTLEPGTYRVEVLSEPPAIFEDVVVEPQRDVELRVGEPGEAAPG